MRKESAWTRNPEVVKRMIVSKTILLAPKSNRLLVLNEQATAVWDILNEMESPRENDIVAALRAEYTDTSNELHSDVRKALHDLHRRGFAYCANDAIPALEVTGS